LGMNKNIAAAAVRKSWRFFLDHAGYAVPPGRAQCALSLAKAENFAKANGFSFEWSDDPHGCSMCGCCPVEKRQPVEVCLCRSENGSVVASLCGICGADKNYRRVIEAELASEAGV